jgi:small subunit ribosomal protein S20
VAHSSSAKKRIRQNVTHRLRNRRRKEVVKSVVRTLDAAITAGKTAEAADQLQQVFSQLDRTAAQGCIHKTTAARKHSRLAKRLAKLSAAKPAAPA